MAAFECPHCRKQTTNMELMARHLTVDHANLPNLGFHVVDEPADPDPISCPKHYTHGKLQPIDVIEDWKLGFRLAQVIKYVARCDHKGSALQDLKKARWYLDREITKREAGE